MPTTSNNLPLTDTVAPTDQAGIATVVREAVLNETPIYPLGGGTSLNYGLAAKRPGVGLSLLGLNRIVDYPARDMTITVEAGITMAVLAETLAGERQRLPIDVPQAGQATLGGVIATNHSGPRRFGCGTMRDYVIGISAVDGRGTPFKGGGRVVKNVAGYDFCKLLTGSLGTLGVITQVTLKLKPIPEASAFVGCEVLDLETAERLLGQLVASAVTPTAVELLLGLAWQEDAALGPLAPTARARLLIGLEGTSAEIEWMIERLQAEWRDQGIAESQVIRDEAVGGLWQRLTEFPADPSALVLRASVTPSATIRLVQGLLQADPGCSIQAHAGNGIILCRCSAGVTSDMPKALVGQLQPAAIAAGGGIVVYGCPPGVEFTRQAQWGGGREDLGLMRAVKEQFDPQGLLNPGRFIYGK